MNICLLTSTFFPLVGGREMVVHNLATALVQIGHNVYVVTPYHRKAYHCQQCNYALIRFGFRGSGRLKLTSFLVILTLFRLVVRHRIDVINIHNVYVPGTWAYYFNRIFRRVPIIGTPHGDDIQTTPEIQDGVRLDPQIDQLVRRNLNSLKRVTAISPSIREDLSQVVINREKIVDVPNGVWVSEFRNDIDKVKIKNKYGIPSDSIVLISVGRNHPRKGFVYAIDAVAKVCNAVTNVSYLLVGRDMSPIVQRAASLGISDRLVTPGEVSSERVSELLQASDIFVSSSIVESFGLTTLEAMSAGLPCVVTNVSGNKDLVSSEYGLLVEPANSDQLANAIKYLIQNHSVRENMGTKARIEAQKYDWPRIAKMYEQVYMHAIQEV